MLSVCLRAALVAGLPWIALGLLSACGAAAEEPSGMNDTAAVASTAPGSVAPLPTQSGGSVAPPVIPLDSAGAPLPSVAPSVAVEPPATNAAPADSTQPIASASAGLPTASPTEVLPVPMDGQPAPAGTPPTQAPVVTDPEPSIVGKPGVVVLDQGIKQCMLLCETDAPETGDNADDDWASENEISCVLPGTNTGQNQACTVGGDIPPPTSKPGVVISDETSGRRCEPLCVRTLTLADDTGSDTDSENGDGWAWEDNSSCVVPESATGSNQGCTTGDPLPEPESRPGIIVEDTSCTAVCQTVTEPSSADSADWGWENNESCVLPGTPTFEDKTACETHVEVDYTPPAPTCTTTHDGFYTEGGKLYDACGVEFVIRGVNSPHVWADIGGKFDAYKALDDIAGYGTNTIRVVWETTGDARLLAEVLFRIVQLKMVPMVELHDVTGDTSADGPLRMAQYYTSDAVKLVLLQFRAYLLINIANEWSGSNFAAAYTDAITELRGAGLEHTLVIDANDWGQGADSIFDNAAALNAADPAQNLMFSVHMYERFADAGLVTSTLSRDKSLALIVGEFGPAHSGINVAWSTILDQAQAQQRGYIAWSWFGNDSSTANLNMVDDWGGALTEWGRNVLQSHAASISRTSVAASVFN